VADCGRAGAARGASCSAVRVMALLRRRALVGSILRESMAAWQCGFLLGPSREASTTLLSGTPEGVWSNADQIGAICDVADIFLKRGTSWSPEIRVWGEEDSTCLEMIYESGDIREILLRIDLRGIDSARLAPVLLGLQRANVLLVGEDGRITEPNVPAVFEALKRSPAWAFVQDPEHFFRHCCDQALLNGRTDRDCKQLRRRPCLFACESNAHKR
jgi:hypothetical protein